MAALVDVLTAGYADERVASTVTLIRDADRLIIVDPGMVADRRLILDPLRALGIEAGDITDIVLSHHHPDHTMNVALFVHALVHDFMATYSNDLWVDHEAGDFVVSESVRLLLTPGHSAEDVTTIAETDDGPVALTHLWWMAEGPAQDPFAPSMETLNAARQQLIALNPVLVVPGHGPAFQISDSTPR
jgi:glyoxylase-like metal-dependent hydrolase (beta-lactamase superfamily II)